MVTKKDLDIILNRIELLEYNINELNKQQEYLLNSVDMIKSLNIKNHLESTNLNNFCPICNEFSNFDSYGVSKRKNAQCPHCKSLEKQRLSYLTLTHQINQINTKSQIKLLHFSPEFIFYKYFSSKKNIDYYPVANNFNDYISKKINIRNEIDMENIKYKNDFFDVIYDSNALQYVSDDNVAIKELYRVLNKNGVCIISIPYYKNLNKTQEAKTKQKQIKYKLNKSKTDTSKKMPLRKYGLDFKEKLESVGFTVEEVGPLDIIRNDFEKDLYGLIDEPIFVCKK